MSPGYHHVCVCRWPVVVDYGVYRIVAHRVSNPRGRVAYIVAPLFLGVSGGADAVAPRIDVNCLGRRKVDGVNEIVSGIDGIPEVEVYLIGKPCTDRLSVIPENPGEVSGDDPALMAGLPRRRCGISGAELICRIPGDVFLEPRVLIGDIGSRHRIGRVVCPASATRAVRPHKIAYKVRGVGARRVDVGIVRVNEP